MHGFWLIVSSATACVSFAASATTASDPPRFQLAGSGTLQLDPLVQKSGNVQLKAYLTPNDAAISASLPAQEGGKFSLAALLSTSSLVCYNDTIFRDGFDGTGL
jgi:hypothetical protein